MTDWRDMKDAPKDGDTFYLGIPCRWVKYKPGAPKHLLRQGGRFQVFNGYGWDNLRTSTLSYDGYVWRPAND